MASSVSTDEIYRILEDEIVDLKLLPGTAISENQCCQRFGVSRTPVRSVLQRLEQNGFVRIVPHKGTVVTVIDVDIVNQMIYQRVAVETAVLRDFVRSAPPLAVERVRCALQRLQSVGDVVGDPAQFDIYRFLNEDLAMHRIWFEMTEKGYLWQRLIAPHPDYSRFIRLDIIGAQNVSEVLRHHAEMMRIIDEKDLDAIEPLIKEHLYGGVRRLSGKLYGPEAGRYADYFRQG